MDNYLSVEEIIYRLKGLKPGESVTYYKGDVASMKPLVGSHVTSRLAWTLHEEGKVHLIQRRLGKPKNHLGIIDWNLGKGPGFEYIAVGKSKRKPAPNFTAHLRSVMEPV